jgi:uncharacterized protein (TIGR02588 family)
MKRNVVEWAVALGSIASIVLLVGILVMQGLSELRPPDPRVELHLDQARTAEMGWIVPATVANGGDQAAAMVVLEATADVGGVPQTSTIDVDFLPAGSSTEIAFAFSAQPDGAVAVRLLGFRVP